MFYSSVDSSSRKVKGYATVVCPTAVEAHTLMKRTIWYI